MLWKTDVALKDSAFFLYFLEEADLHCRLETGCRGQGTCN